MSQQRTIVAYFNVRVRLYRTIETCVLAKIALDGQIQVLLATLRLLPPGATNLVALTAHELGQC